MYDLIYGVEIKLKDYEERLINTSIMNRLKHIKQLGVVNLSKKYPNANHNRYQHTIGVLYLADLLAKHLKLDNQQICAARLSALFHDVGHGPFSHLTEKFLQLLKIENKHENVSAEKILNDLEISTIWKKNPDLPEIELISKIISKNVSNEPLVEKIISNDIDVDRMDYLLRDINKTGLGFKFDYNNIISGLDKINKTEICIRKDSVLKDDYIIDANFLLLSRVLLRHHVYYEPVHRAIEMLLFYSLEDACKTINPSIFSKIDESELKHKLFYELNDESFLYELKKSSLKNKKVIEDIEKGVIYNYVPKVIKWREISPYLQDELLDVEKNSIKKYDIIEKIREKLSKKIGVKIDDIIIDIPRLEKFQEAQMKVISNNGHLTRLDDFVLTQNLKEVYRNVWTLMVYIKSSTNNNIENNIKYFFKEY